MATTTKSYGDGPSASPKETTLVYDRMQSCLVPVVGKEKASQWALFAQEVYDFVQEDPDVQAAIRAYKRWSDGKDVAEGLDKIGQGGKFASRALDLQLAESARRFKDFRLVGVGGILKIFVEHFEVIAKQRGLELNECAMQIVKVCLQIAAAGAEAVTVWGLVLASFDVLSTFRDAYGLGKACFVSP